MQISFPFKNFFIALTVVAVVIVFYLVYALAGLSARPVVFAEPPVFVERNAAEMVSSVPTTTSMNSENLTLEFSEEEALVHQVIFDGESPDLILPLFTHPEKAQRVRMAAAFAAVNVEFTHDEESGFAAKREQFWIDVEEQLPSIQNALSEALIASAEAGTTTRIPYTLAWMPGQGRETVEVLTWAAKHHPDPWVRRFSVYFVVKFGGYEELAGPLLRNRTHDPEYKVRKEVLEQRIRRLIE